MRSSAAVFIIGWIIRGLSGKWKSSQPARPEASENLSREVVAFVQRLRTEDLFKKPGVAETIDWAKCLLGIGRDHTQPRSDRGHPWVQS